MLGMDDDAGHTKELAGGFGPDSHEAVEPHEPGSISPGMIELEKIPRRLWEQTLAPLHRSQRSFAASRVSDPALRAIAFELTMEMDIGESERRITRETERGRLRRRGASLPIPRVSHGTTQPTVQVNVRFRADDHARLGQAAATVGMKPTTLARALVLNGVAMILRENSNLAA